MKPLLATILLLSALCAGGQPTPRPAVSAFDLCRNSVIDGILSSNLPSPQTNFQLRYTETFYLPIQAKEIKLIEIEDSKVTEDWSIYDPTNITFFDVYTNTITIGTNRFTVAELEAWAEAGRPMGATNAAQWQPPMLGPRIEIFPTNSTWPHDTNCPFCVNATYTNYITNPP